MAGEQNNDQSAPAADNATVTETVGPLMPEYGPAGPPDGDDSPKVDTDLVLDTFFGGSGAGQASESNASDDQSDQGSLARPSAASAANGEDGSSNEPGPSSTPAQQPGQKQANEGGTGAQTSDQSPGSSDSKPSSSGLSVEERLALASVEGLREQNRQLLERLNQQGQAQPQGQGTQPQTQQPGAGQEQVQRLVVPDQIAAAIMSDDPNAAKQGMDLLITAVAHNAVNMALAKVAPMIDAKMAEVVQYVQGGTQVNKMEEDFFKRFPHLNNELYRPVIQATVDEKFKAFPGARWDEVMMDAVGSTVNSKLQALGINPVAPNAPAGQEPNGQAQQKPNGRAKPAAQLDGSTRSSVPANQGSFIADTFR